MKKKIINVFEDVENLGNWYITYTKDKEKAWKQAIFDYPEITKQFTIDDMEEVIMYKCLDCESYWVSDDVCGECGEYRLSKRQTPSYHIGNY